MEPTSLLQVFIPLMQDNIYFQLVPLEALEPTPTRPPCPTKSPPMGSKLLSVQFIIYSATSTIAGFNPTSGFEY